MSGRDDGVIVLKVCVYNTLDLSGSEARRRKEGKKKEKRRTGIILSKIYVLSSELFFNANFRGIKKKKV